jgi:hypothetical protein
MSTQAINSVRRRLAEMQELEGCTLGQIEEYLSCIAMRGDGECMILSAYLSADDPAKWLDKFLAMEIG